MTAKKRINLVPATVATLQFSEREKAAMDAATLYLPDDGTDWPKHVEAAITILCKTMKERGGYYGPTDSPAYLAVWAMELMGPEYCRPRTSWYLRLIDKAYRAAFPGLADDAEYRLGEHARLSDGLTQHNSRAAEVIFEREHNKPAPWINRAPEEQAHD